MQLIPAIDIKNGQCVRLKQGDMNQVTVFHKDPVMAADHWISKGATRLHLVDLNGAIMGKPCHTDVLSRIRKAHPDIKIQYGGGVRKTDDIDMILKAGADQVIVGTLAVLKPEAISSYLEKQPDQVILGVDTNNGILKLKGWTEQSSLDLVQLIDTMVDAGLKRLMHTDTTRDGMENGIDIKKCRFLERWSHLWIVAAGGIGTPEHVRAARQLINFGVSAIVAGTSLYTGAIDFEDSVQALKGDTC